MANAAKKAAPKAKNFKASLENKAIEAREAKAGEKRETKRQERAETQPPRIRRKT